MGVPRQFEQCNSFGKIGFVRAAMVLDLALAAVLLLAPLVRHFFEEGGVHQPVELVDVHRVNAIVQPLRLGLKPLDRFFVLAAFVGVAGVKGVAQPFQHVVIESQPPEQFGELRFKHLLADIFAAAVGGLALTLIRIAGAMVIDVALLLDFADHRAAASVAGNEAGECEIPSALLRTARVAPVHHFLNPFP